MMSGITPLLDTLLPQVLAKRVDTLAQALVTKPLSPVIHADAVRQLSSDPRLDGSGSVFKGFQLSSSKVSPKASFPANTLADQEVATRLSPTAKTLSDILSSARSLPPTVMTKTPLIPSSEEVAHGVLRNRIEASIRESGLFYESHLARWYQGRLPLGQLAKEPQMQIMSNSLQGNDSTYREAGVEKFSTTLTDTTVGRVQSTTSSSQIPNAAVRGQSAVDQERAGVITDSTESSMEGLDKLEVKLPELLQGIVRNQLDLLSMPILHWQGEVWAGVFMAMLLQFPENLCDQQDNQQSTGDETESDSWSTEIAVSMEHLGLVKVKIQIVENRLDLKLQAGSEEVLDKVTRGIAELEQRLSGIGFEMVSVSIKVVETGHGG